MLCRRKRSGRITMLALLILVLGLAMVALLLDFRARSLSENANDSLAELTSGETDLSEIQALIERNPTSTKEVNGGVIEVYNYGGGIPGRSYTILIGYGENAEQRMRYLDHNLNQLQGELQLEQVIAAHQQRILYPPPEETEDLAGPVEVPLNDVYKGVQSDLRLVLAYDTATRMFGGTIESMTRETIKRIRVVVHLSNGKELGPITLGDLEPGSGFDVELKAESTDFDRWTAYVESDLYPNEKYDAVRYGVHVVLAYDSEATAFSGTVRNTTAERIDGIRIVVRLSDGATLGPAVLDAIPPDSELDVELKTERDDFSGWSVHIVVDSP